MRVDLGKNKKVIWKVFITVTCGMSVSLIPSYDIYSSPPLMQPLLGNDKSGRIRGVAAGEA